MYKNHVKNIIRILFSNLTVILTGLLTAIILPNILGVRDYGFWQLYLFYSGFVSLLTIGFNDGIYLRYAGQEYTSLNKPLFRTYFWLLNAFLTISSIVIAFLLLFFVDDPNRLFSYLFVTASILIINLNSFFIHINQITSRFGIYSIGLALEKGLFILCIIPILFVPTQSFKLYVTISFITRVIVLIFNIIYAKDLIFGKWAPLKEMKTNNINNVIAGLPLTLSNLVAMLIPGIGRIVVEYEFGIEEFGAYSFAFSIMALFILLISSFSSFLYPVLKRADKTYIPSYYSKTSNTILFASIILFLSYFPIIEIIKLYFPLYVTVLDYLYLLFPVMIYLSKNQIIVHTLFQVLRLERSLLKLNISLLLLSVILVTTSVWLMSNVISIVFATLICVMAWNYIGEWYLQRKWNLAKQKKISEIPVVIGFILIQFFFTEELALTLTLVFFMTYLITIRKKLIGYIHEWTGYNAKQKQK